MADINHIKTDMQMVKVDRYSIIVPNRQWPMEL